MAKCCSSAPTAPAKGFLHDVLRKLLLEHATADALNRRLLNKRIWRSMRWIKRCQAREIICSAAKLGRLPVSSGKNLLINRTRLCGARQPSDFLAEFYTDIYYVDPQTVAVEESKQDFIISIWHRLRIDVVPFCVTLDRLIAVSRN